MFRMDLSVYNLVFEFPSTFPELLSPLILELLLFLVLRLSSPAAKTEANIFPARNNTKYCVKFVLQFFSHVAILQSAV